MSPVPRKVISQYSTSPQKNPWAQFCDRWRGGCGSESCPEARNVVLARGKVPCDFLFVGEAPGESEDVCGQPFLGPAGKLLDQIIASALDLIPNQPAGGYRFAFTNLVCCIPREVEGGKASEPLPEDIDHCAPRLRDFVDLARPRLIVCVGSLARDFLDHKMKGSVWDPTTTEERAARRGKVSLTPDLHPGGRIPRVHIRHPAGLLRMNEAIRDLEIRRCVVTLANAIEEYLG